MSVIEQVYRDREDLARVLEKHAGIRKLVEDLYPDTAHFIYELLQNAEDAGASEAAFFLSEDALVFEHYGRPFEKCDIWGITDIGAGTKAEDEEKIGRFGIGFKAVFAYTETPRIWSPTYAFKICKMVLPSEIPKNPDLGKRTRFEFPFNSVKKPQNEAFKEVCDGLKDISDNTLLFLSSIKEIRWRVDGGGERRLRRIKHSDHHIEILRETDDGPTASSHFLRFTKPVDGLEPQQVAIAFELEPLSNDGQTDAPADIAEQFRIVPAKKSGCVAVYFTAKKETSNLRFHLHAPFVPELSRSSIKDTPANEPLFRQIALLAARSLSSIRCLGLLDRDFLSVLPNSQDDITAPYTSIKDAIVGEMNEQPLTPTRAGGHAPARRLLQAEDGLKDLLDPDDIRFLVDGDDDRCDWAVAKTQRNIRVDRFLGDLDIRQWGVKQFVETLGDRCSKRTWDKQPVLDWMSGKPVEWHRALYAFFYRELKKYDLYRFKDICIVRCSDGEFRTGADCYFPTPEIREDPIHPRVAEDTYTGSGNKTEQEHARAFLEGVGVSEVGEFEQVEAILEQRYADPDQPPPWKTHESDLRRFIGLTEKDGNAASLFKGYSIFQRADSLWSRPCGLYLDEPYPATGLDAYYSRFGPESKRAALSGKYRTFDMREQLICFSIKCGVADRLEIDKVSCDKNPDRDYLHSAPGYETDTREECDFVIPGLKALFESPTLALSRLVWKTLCDRPQDERILQAAFRNNKSRGWHYADSQLVHHLRTAAWIPQGDGTSSSTDFQFVRPAEALRDLLPDDFPFALDWAWLAAVRFGTKTDQKIGGGLGFRDEAELADAKRFAKLEPDVRRKILAEHETPTDLPKHKPGNPSRRAQKVREEAEKAPERKTEERSRSISVNRDPVKREKTDPYLLDLYTNTDGVTICQACADRLPFKLSDGHYYFESVEFLRDLKKHHYQNYLALCPNHAAMFMYANNSKDEMRERFLALDGNRLKLTLAGQSVTVYFTESHRFDLREVIQVDDAE